MSVFTVLKIIDSLDSVGDLLRLMRPGLFTEPRGVLGPFITRHSVKTKSKKDLYFQTGKTSCKHFCF